MKKGYLSEYFESVGAKKLSAVEADQARSHQHEFNGDENLRALFGAPPDKQEMKADFLYFNDTEDEPVTATGYVTWYDARARSAWRTGRSEYRLYFPTTVVSLCCAEGDLLLIGRKSDGSVLVIVAEGGSTTEGQLLWLFGFSHLTHPGFSVRSELETEQDRISFAARIILKQIRIEPEERAESYLDEMLKLFGRSFPSTKDFSGYARGTLPEVSALDDPDASLMAWLDREEILFRTLERELVAERLQRGFVGDVDGFISFSLSVQNRRKSRAGYALENHLEYVFKEWHILFERNVITENKSKPDFLFPGTSQYHSGIFPASQLTMLASKSSCKDRWRQVLVEADKIKPKHLITLETAISQAQTDEMKGRELQLVVPAQLHVTYTSGQQMWLQNLGAFIRIVASRQEVAGLN